MMKNINQRSLLTSLIFCLSLSSYAQIVDYVNFPVDTAKWTQTVNLQGFEPGMPYTEKGMDYYFLGDTMIDGNLYQKVYSKFLYSVSEDTGFFLRKPLNLIGGIREDSLKRIYFLYLTDIRPEWDNAFYHFTTGNEYLLYDFNIEIGDTLDWIVPSEQPNVLIDIDTIELYDNHFRRKFIFTDSLWDLTDNYWISGIGSSIGLFGTYRSYNPNVYDPRLVCFNDKINTVLIENVTVFEEVESCVFFHDQPLVEEMDNENENEESINSLSEAKIYPIPMEGELNINIPKDLKVSVEIFDINSRLVYRADFESDLINIKLPNLVSGIYLLKIFTEEEEVIREILKL